MFHWIGAHWLLLSLCVVAYLFVIYLALALMGPGSDADDAMGYDNLPDAKN